MYRPSEGPCQLLTEDGGIESDVSTQTVMSGRQTGHSLLSLSRSQVVQRPLKFVHEDSSCERIFEWSPVVSHSRLGQTPLVGPPWRISVTAGPANSGPGLNKEVVLPEGLKSH